MKAWQLIQERGWCQQSLALDQDGEDTSPLTPEAVAFCAYGALLRAYRGQAQAMIMYYGIDQDSLQEWNDSPLREPEDVIHLLKLIEGEPSYRTLLAWPRFVDEASEADAIPC